jgi:hypothetical protein
VRREEGLLAVRSVWGWRENCAKAVLRGGFEGSESETAIIKHVASVGGCVCLLCFSDASFFVIACDFDIDVLDCEGQDGAVEGGVMKSLGGAPLPALRFAGFRIQRSTTSLKLDY